MIQRTKVRYSADFSRSRQRMTQNNRTQRNYSGYPVIIHEQFQAGTPSQTLMLDDECQINERSLASPRPAFKLGLPKNPPRNYLQST